MAASKTAKQRPERAGRTPETAVSGERQRTHRRSRLATCLALCAVAQGCGAPGPVRPNLVLVTVDSLRPDRLACYGGPEDVGRFICSLARSGSRYLWAFSPSPFSAVAIASVFTSQYPSDHGVTALASSALASDSLTLAEVLASGGYTSGAFVANPALNRSRNLQQGFDVYHDRPTRLARREGEETAPRSAARLSHAALEFAAQAPEPWFIWIHYAEPRGPYAALSAPDSTPPARATSPTARKGRATLLPLLTDHSGRSGVPAYQVPTPRTEDPLQPRPRSSHELLQRYDEEIRRVDRQIERLIEELDELGRPGVLVTADHGEALGEDDYWFAHGHSVGLDQIWVPLVWRPPHQLDSDASERRNRVVVEAVGTLDVAPTLLDAAHLTRPEVFDGVSLDARTGLRASGDSSTIFAEHPLRAAAVAEGVYYARDRSAFDTPVHDEIRGGVLHPLPPRFARLGADGRRSAYLPALGVSGAQPASPATPPPAASAGLPDGRKSPDPDVAALEFRLAEFMARGPLEAASPRAASQAGGGALAEPH